MVTTIGPVAATTSPWIVRPWEPSRDIVQPVRGVPPWVMPNPGVLLVAAGQPAGTSVRSGNCDPDGVRKKRSTVTVPTSEPSGCQLIVYPAIEWGVPGTTATFTSWTACATPGRRPLSPTASPSAAATRERHRLPSKSAAAGADRLRTLFRFIFVEAIPSRAIFRGVIEVSNAHGGE